MGRKLKVINIMRMKPGIWAEHSRNIQDAGRLEALQQRRHRKCVEPSQSKSERISRIFAKAGMTATLLEEVVRLAELQTPCELRLLSKLAPSAYSICAAPARHFRSVRNASLLRSFILSQQTGCAPSALGAQRIRRKAPEGCSAHDLQQVIRR